VQRTTRRLQSGSRVGRLCGSVLRRDTEAGHCASTGR
jgi:hypothetical protein